MTCERCEQIVHLENVVKEKSGESLCPLCGYEIPTDVIRKMEADELILNESLKESLRKSPLL